MNQRFSFATPRIGSIIFASVGLMCASSSSAQAERSMMEVQSLTSQRATMGQVMTGMTSSLQDGSKAVAGNLGGGGTSAPPGGGGTGTPPDAVGRANRGSIEPQPMPLVDRAGPGFGNPKPEQYRDMTRLNPQPLPPAAASRRAGSALGAR